tara:strand:- start:207 stop:1028 length:822 start_codon:yes stop_codon:yes gene_type:complete
MYDFKFKSKKEVLSNPEDFLIFVKRLLPRWANGIPDSEAIALYKLLKLLKKKNKKLTIVETGVGASTVALFLYCAINGGRVFSWDHNGHKGSYLKTVLSEAICTLLKVDLNKHLTFVPFDPTDRYVGISVLKELKIKADFAFFDSLHTHQQVFKELREFEEISSSNFIVAVDDAYYERKYTNFPYINMLRSKLNLNIINEPKDNIGKALHVELYNHLVQKYKRVSRIKDYYKKNYKNDIFFKYFSGDREFMDKYKMEEKNKLRHRLEAFKIIK